MEKQKAIEILKRQLGEISNLKQQGYDSSVFKEWHRNTKVAISNIFSKDNGSHVDEFEKINYSPTRWYNTGGNNGQETYSKGLETTGAILVSMIKEIQDYWPDEEKPTAKIKKPTTKVSSNNREVFIVHGHDNEAKQTVARFIEKLKLKPIILHEKPNEGRTIIEKFEKHSDVGFAVVLMTPDDVGALAKDKDNLNPRARQNVILELGFFLGSLGREHVCALYKEGVEIPSDYKGVLFIPMNDNSWQFLLAKEMKAAGIKIDMNDL